MLAASPRLRRDRSYSASKSVEFRLEIGRTPRRDRFISAARSVVFRVEIGRAAAGLLFADGSGVRYVVFAPRACRACLDVGSAGLKWTDLDVGRGVSLRLGRHQGGVGRLVGAAVFGVAHGRLGPLRAEG